MIFGRKSKQDELKCETCSSAITSDFRFCPYCGVNLIDLEEEVKEFGMLGRIDESRAAQQNPLEGLGITDKLIGSIMNNLMKNIDSQFKDMEKMDSTEIRSFPNGIKIKIGGIPIQTKQVKKERNMNKHLTESQLKRMADLPRAAAKTQVRRLSDKVVYILSAPGIRSEEDIIVSKLENGYEVKAIGDKKVYVNSLPLSLPLRRVSLAKNKLLVEFKLQSE